MKPKNKGGRPKFEPTPEQRKIVKMMTGFAIDQEKICSALDISGPTLRKHFKKEIKIGSAQLEAQLAGNMYRLAGGSDGTAFRANEFILNCRFGWSRYAPPPPPPKAPELGKKERLQMAAETGHEETGWGELLQ